MTFEHDATHAPSGEYVTDRTWSTCFRWKGATFSPVLGSQNLTVLSREADVIRIPSGENATEVTSLSCSWIWENNAIPVTASQMQMVLSFDPDTIFAASGENFTERTQSSWPSNAVRTSKPETASHTRTLLSMPPEAIRDPSGEKQTEKMLLRRNSAEKGGVTSAPDVAFHIRMPLEPDIIWLPSVEKATDIAGVLCLRTNRREDHDCSKPPAMRGIMV